MTEDRGGRRLLVDLLHEAAQLEHSLLDAYLYAACSLKSTPEELALVDSRENRRRAIQFERLRAWKLSLLLVAHEEMGHLHYVQCMLRALGEPPSFALPRRAEDSGNWVFPAWKAMISGKPVDKGGVEIPVEPLSLDAARRFVVYESTDALQDEDPFGPEAMKLFERLHEFEVDCRFESMLFAIPDRAEREQMKAELADLYGALTPVPEEKIAAFALERLERELPEVEKLSFQSIADLYEQGILPLYREAFDFGWVTHNNLDLGNELLDPNYAQEGLLPIGPIRRRKNFEDLEDASQGEAAEPLRNYMEVAEVISAIVDEGEGATGFKGGAEALLGKYEELGARGYLEAVQKDSKEKTSPTPEWLENSEFLRESHLYRFAMVMTELEQERDLAARVGVDFDPAREPVSVDESVPLEQMADELPAQFNACYLALIAWLSRIYEVREWAADRPRRQAIEMLGSWPLMSIAIRPLLELASFLPVDPRNLFRLDEDELPLLPIHAQQLHRLYTGKERSEEINERMDYMVVKTLSNVSAWARAQIETVAEAPIDPHVQEMMTTRLGELGHLDEFEKQFPYRVHGGYSNRPPDREFIKGEPDAERFEENPESLNKKGIFEDALVLCLRFSGRGLVQMATDPDPPADEVGCTGTHMRHAADAGAVFDRALVWQPDDDPGHAVVRGPEGKMPKLGVDCREATLMVTGADGKGTAAFVPSGVMNSGGAVQTTGAQMDMVVRGLQDLLALSPMELTSADKPIRLELRPKNGQWPFQNGYNHLVWRDGEPIDPFVLSVRAGDTLLQREIYNKGRTLLEMTPLQRQLSARGPWGFDSYTNIPDWVIAELSAEERKSLAEAGFPMSFLSQRAGILAEALRKEIGSRQDEPAQSWVDDVVSLAERMRLVSVPRGTTVAWLTILLRYGHTVSGELTIEGGENPILAALRSRTGLGLSFAEGGDRQGPNMRWLLHYTQGVMDTDGLSDLVFGELYVPLTVQVGPDPVTFSRRWSFPTGIRDALAEYACRFDAPFWANFVVEGNTRTTSLPNGTEIVETLERQESDSYAYSMIGPPGISDYHGSFSLSPPDAKGRVTLEWKDTFRAADEGALVSMLSTLAGAAETIANQLRSHFGPVED